MNLGKRHGTCPASPSDLMTWLIAFGSFIDSDTFSRFYLLVRGTTGRHGPLLARGRKDSTRNGRNASPFKVVQILFKFCSKIRIPFKVCSNSVQSLNESVQSLNEAGQHGLRLQTVSGNISQRGMERWSFLEPRMILFLNHESSLITRIHAACVL